MTEANQVVTAVLALVFAAVMLVGTRSFVDLRSAREAARPLQVASVPL
jgi:hypothetical protein